MTSKYSNAIALQLRFGQASAEVGSPSVEAFAAAPATTPARSDSIDSIPYGIPSIQSSPRCAVPLLRHWALRRTNFASRAPLVAGPAHKRGGTLAWMVAACLPLIYATNAAAAPDEEPKVQRPRPIPVVPNLPEDPVAQRDEPSAQPAPREPAGPATDSSPDPSVDAASSEPPQTHADPFIGPSAPDPELAALDAAWAGVDGSNVLLRLKGGKKMRGRVGAVQRETFTLIELSTGIVSVLPKSGVTSLRADIPAPVPAEDGRGLLIGGAILTTFAAPTFVTGMAFLGVCPSCIGLNAGLIIAGGGGLAGGIPMLVLGSRRRSAYRKALREHQVVPSFARTHHGWTGGLRFRF